MSDHTPGPWPLGRARTCDHYTIGDRAPYIAAVRKEADARLIAAAPDLVAALREIADAEPAGAVPAGGALTGWQAAHAKLCGYARAALAKAGAA